MKKLLLTFTICVGFYSLHAQEYVTRNPNGSITAGFGIPAFTPFPNTENFTYDQKTMGQYSLGWFSDSWNTGSPTMWVSGYAGIKLFTAGKPRLSIPWSGYVGIGTTTPDCHLDVVGTIRAHQVLVNTQKGADFVFEDGYNLRPLEEVEQFITENKHLPDIVPANTMVEKGVDMGALQMQLLQKMEEMTLYMIDLKKKNNAQMEYIVTLEKRIADLEK